jgi:hypothetical protein
MWRYILRFAVTSDAGLFGTSIDTPIRQLRNPLMSDDQWATHCAAQADYIINVDACKDSSRLGIGVVIADHAGAICGWLSFAVPELHQYWRDDAWQPTDINLLECFAFVTAIVSFITEVLPQHSSVSLQPSSVSPSVIQIHIWSDNTSTLSWITKRRALSPLHAYFIQLVSHLLLQSGVLLTSGHIPGVRNALADAPSRDFLCPDGPTIRSLLHDSHRLHPSSVLRRDTAHLSQTPSLATSTVAHQSLMTAAAITGRSFVGSGDFHPF